MALFGRSTLLASGGAICYAWNGLDSATVKILEVRVSRSGLGSALESCSRRGREGLGGYVCFANVHSVSESSWNPELRAALNGAYASLADGMPLVWTARLKGRPLASRVCGPDFMAAYLRQSRGGALGFIGGPPGQAERIAAEYGVRGVCYSPPMRPFSAASAREDWSRFLDLCGSAGPPEVVWVGLGAPKQELWMSEVSAIATQTLFFGVGAAFDFLSGTKDRAPVWMQKSGLEWLYRLSKEPRRLWRRYLVSNGSYVVLVSLDLFRSALSRR